MAVFPEGMKSATVTMDAADFGMGVVAGTWLVEAETPAIWKATDLLLLKTPIPKASTRGKASVTVAASQQSGFVGRGPGGEFSIPSRAYRFTFTASRDGSIYQRFVYVPASATPVPLMSLADLGGWPNATPTGSPALGSAQYVQVAPGLWKWQAAS